MTELEDVKHQLAELKRGLRNNNTDFELAFLDAYLDRFRNLTRRVEAAELALQAKEQELAQMELRARVAEEADPNEDLRSQLAQARQQAAEPRKYPILVVAALIIRDGKILLERRAPNGVAGLDLMWDLPGGKVECGEEPAQAVVREIQEEMGVTISPIQLLQPLKRSVWTYGDKEKHWIIAAYVCSIIGGEPQCSEQLAWFDIDSLEQSTILAADFELITNAMRSLTPPSALTKEK